MSELTQAVAEADAMEDALAAPLFDGVRADVDAVLDGERDRDLAFYRNGFELMAKAADEARHAKGQMELRWQAAEKECAALRAQVAAMAKCKPDCYDIHGNRNHQCTKEIEACQATHPGQNWCEKCR